MFARMIASRQVKKAFDARNRRDIDAFLAGWAENAVLVFPGPVGGNFRGIESIRSFFREQVERFPRERLNATRVYVSRPFGVMRQDVAVEWQTELEDETGHRSHHEGVTCLQIRDGKVQRAVEYLFDPSATAAS
jgi:ketosteroid isomerase-like protein